MFREKHRKSTLGLKEVMIATSKIMESNKFKDESMEGILLQISLLKQIIESLQVTEKALSKNLSSKIDITLQN